MIVVFFAVLLALTALQLRAFRAGAPRDGKRAS